MAQVEVKGGYHNITVIEAPTAEDLEITNKSGSIIYVALCDFVDSGTSTRQKIVSQEANASFKEADGLIPIKLGETKTVSKPTASFLGEYPNAQWCLFERDKMLRETQVVEIL